MKKKNILAGLAMFAVLAAIAGGASQVMAAGNATSSGIFGFFKSKGHPAALTDAQKAEIKTKMDAVKAAEAAGDYNAWVAAVKAMDENSSLLKRVTSAEAFKTYVEKNKAREAQMADRKAKMDAVNAALAAGGYNAWVAAVKAMDANSPILQKINADNFAKYVEAYKLRTQADSIMKDLGLDQGERGGFGFGGMHDGPRGGTRGEMEAPDEK